jgi:hypothetical protein
MQTDDEKLIAIDILLEPDQTLIGKARLVNATLRENFPAGYELDASHAPHISCCSASCERRISTR